MYYTEYLPRLNAISVILDVPQDYSISSSTRIILENPQQLVIQSDQGHPLRFKLPQPITLEFSVTSLVLQNQVLSFKILFPAVGKPDDSSIPVFMNQIDQKWSCKDLKSKTPKSNNNHTFQFICSNCKHSLINSDEYKFKDMPSEYWYEMMDFWHCHKPESNEPHQHTKNYNGVLLPQDNDTIIIGSYYLLQKSNPNLNSQDANCIKCKSVLGETIQENVLKILKWKISLVYQDKQEQFNSKLFVYNSLIDKINSSAVRRFKVKLHNEWRYIWVMNLGLKVAINGEVLTNALKVAFTEIVKDQDNYEEVNIPYSEIIDEFINDLYIKHSELPASINTVKNGSTTFKISFISPD